MPNLYEIDWSASMQQTYEFYKVDPDTWRDMELINVIESCSIDRDSSSDTLGSASFDCSEDLGECYIRTYLIINQNGLKHKECLGTHLVQAPSKSFDGKTHTISMDGYTPLIELKNNRPPIGYSLLEGDNIMQTVIDKSSENLRAPVIYTASDVVLYSNFVSNLDDTWFSFLNDLMANAKYSFALEPDGRVVFSPIVDTAALQPVWIYTDNNSSILLPDVSDEGDLYDIPNVVEVIYSKDAGYFYAKVVNDDMNSPISTVNRGREIVYRETSPNISAEPTDEYIQEYAKNLLRSLSCLEHTITYSHAYCPVRLGDCVMLNYKAAGLTNIKARVIQQSIQCETGCIVEETATYTTKLWG